MKLNINNLSALIKGVKLTTYQRSLAVDEWHKLIGHVNKLEENDIELSSDDKILGEFAEAETLLLRIQPDGDDPDVAHLYAILEGWRDELVKKRNINSSAKGCPFDEPNTFNPNKK